MHTTMSSSNRRPKPHNHNLLLRIVAICIALNVIVQLSLHLHLDQHLAVELVKQSQTDGGNNIIIFNHQSGITHYKFSKSQAETSFQTYGRHVIFQPLRAYIEKELNDTVPNTLDTGNLDEKKPKVEVGRPGRWYVPLPLREGTPDDVSCFCADSSCYSLGNTQQPLLMLIHFSIHKFYLYSLQYSNTATNSNHATICPANYQSTEDSETTQHPMSTTN